MPQLKLNLSNSLRAGLLVGFFVTSVASAQTAPEQLTHFKRSPHVDDLGVGHSIDVDGDTLVVGSSPDTSASGSVLVFRRGANGWAQEAILEQAFPDADDEFGASVAISGDTLVVGTAFEDGGSQGINGDEQLSTPAGTDTGAVYVFVRNGTQWTQQAYIKASNANMSDRFGSTVTLEGDRLVVAAISEATDLLDPSPTLGLVGGGEGAVYVFERSGSTWTQAEYMRAPMVSDGFGSDLDLEGDTLVVGADQEPNPLLPNFGKAGAVYVLLNGPNGWALQAQLQPRAETAGYFGTAVALDGDRLVVGGDYASTLKGGITLFERTGTTWVEQAWVLAALPWFPLNLIGVGFGQQVDLQGDSVVVGARWENGASSGINGSQAGSTQGENSGAVFHYRIDQGTLQLETYVKASNPEAQANFGQGLVYDGERLFVGAPRESSSSGQINGDQTLTGVSSGAVYEIDLDGPDASVAIRTFGSNPLSLTSNPPIVGTPWLISVDLTTTGHPFSAMAFFLRPNQFNLGQPNQWVLVGNQFPAGELFGLAPVAGPVSSYPLNVPPLASLLGRELHAQAFHFGGGLPIVCSNALDLVIGN